MYIHFASGFGVNSEWLYNVFSANKFNSENRKLPLYASPDTRVHLSRALMASIYQPAVLTTRCKPNLNRSLFVLVEFVSHTLKACLKDFNQFIKRRRKRHWLQTYVGCVSRSVIVCFLCCFEAVIWLLVIVTVTSLFCVCSEKQPFDYNMDRQRMLSWLQKIYISPFSPLPSEREHRECTLQAGSQ